MCRAIRPMVSSSLLVVCQPRLITATRMPVARAIAIITPSTSGPGLRYFLFWLDADICSSRRCCPRPLLSSAFSCFWIMRYLLPLCPEAYHVSSFTTTPHALYRSHPFYVTHLILRLLSSADTRTVS